ncbi:hypothetical protein LEP1GSC043_3182 [Leptospira weilii str. Ecochallenge]|uniref:Uncharacterized protein n=1 Tax=Leptospira weilii str. Ecochallenge TaxID=1049986 RepID=N1U4W1_9LEPT|nr:hypothetical protein LEP1GSC043_3182 [Leptospira weilii str. Ecochallenge]
MNFHPRKKKGFKNCFRNVKLILNIYMVSKHSSFYTISIFYPSKIPTGEPL